MKTAISTEVGDIVKEDIVYYKQIANALTLTLAK